MGLVLVYSENVATLQGKQDREKKKKENLHLGSADARLEPSQRPLAAYEVNWPLCYSGGGKKGIIDSS